MLIYEQDMVLICNSTGFYVVGLVVVECNIYLHIGSPSIINGTVMALDL